MQTDANSVLNRKFIRKGKKEIRKSFVMHKAQVGEVYRFSFLLILFLTISEGYAFAQGSWDIIYTPIDSLSPALIGKEVRIDFKGTDSDTLKGEVKALEIRSLLSKEDTVTLFLEGESVKFKENWNLYVDQGELRSQTLERVGTAADEKIYIKEMYLVAADQKNLTLEVIISNPSGRTRASIVIRKSDVKGVLQQL